MTASERASTAALLRALPGHGFVPPAADAPWSVDARAAAFAADVETFAADYWALAPAARAARWADLAARAVGPATARLRELGAGLDVVAVAHADARAAELAALVRKWFVLPARERAARRAAWFQADRRAWAAAAPAVIRDDLATARLDPTLFDQLAVGGVLRPVAPVPGVSAVPFGDPLHFDSVPRRGRESAFSTWQSWGLGFFLVIGVMRFAAAGCGHRPVPAPGAPPPHNPQAPRSNAPFTADDVRRNQEYDRAGATGPAPYRWREWVLAGRPGAEEAK